MPRGKSKTEVLRPYIAKLAIVQLKVKTKRHLGSCDQYKAQCSGVKITSKIDFSTLLLPKITNIILIKNFKCQGGSFY